MTREHPTSGAVGGRVGDALRTERSWVTKLPELWGRSSRTISRRGVIIVVGVMVALFDVSMAHGRTW